MKLVESINLNNIRGGITADIVALPFALAMVTSGTGAGAGAGLYDALITG